MVSTKYLYGNTSLHVPLPCPGVPFHWDGFPSTDHVSITNCWVARRVGPNGPCSARAQCVWFHLRQ